MINGGGGNKGAVIMVVISLRITFSNTSTVSPVSCDGDQQLMS